MLVLKLETEKLRCTSVLHIHPAPLPLFMILDILLVLGNILQRNRTSRMYTWRFSIGIVSYDYEG